MNKLNRLTAALSFLKAGLIGFGGGAALIPVIETEVVENNKWVEKEEFDKTVAITGIAPGSLPVALSTIWNIKYSFVCAYSYAFPGPFIYLILLTGFAYIGQAGAEYLKNASVGLISFVLFILYRFIKRKYQAGASIGEGLRFFVIILASFVLTGGNQVKKLLNILFGAELPVSLFSLDIIHLVLLAVFFITFTGGSRSKIKFTVSCVFVLLYALANGKGGILSSFTLYLAAIMFLMSIGSILYDYFKNAKKEKKPLSFNLKPLKNILIFLSAAFLFTLGVFIITKDSNAWDFAKKTFSSALTSFGGGEVYIGISENTFVETGFISREIYTTQILGIANTMPGPVLVSIVTGIGFTYGNTVYGTAQGWLFGLLGFSLAVTASAFGASVLLMFFDLLKNSPRLHMLTKYIIPVVCGVLVTTALSLFCQAVTVLNGKGINEYLSCGIVIAIFMIMLFLRNKYRINDIILLLSGGAGTLIALSLL